MFAETFVCPACDAPMTALPLGGHFCFSCQTTVVELDAGWAGVQAQGGKTERIRLSELRRY